MIGVLEKNKNIKLPQVDKLIAGYNFDSDTLLMKDVVSNHDGIHENQLFENGLHGKAKSYNGTTYSEISDSDILSFTDGTKDIPFSFSFWVKYSEVGDFMLFNKMGGSTDREFFVHALPGSLRFQIYSGTGTSNYITKDFPMTKEVNKWYHIVCTYDGTGTHDGMKLYLNNLSVGTGSVTGTFNRIFNGNSNVIIGRHAGVKLLYHRGAIDELYIWKNHVLTSLQVGKLYNKGEGSTYTPNI